VWALAVLTLASLVTVVQRVAVVRRALVEGTR
jgi:hypothetical protein